MYTNALFVISFVVFGFTIFFLKRRSFIAVHQTINKYQQADIKRSQSPFEVSALQLLQGNSSFVKVLLPQKANLVYLEQDKAAYLPLIGSGRLLHWKVDSRGPPSGLCCHMELSAVVHFQSFAQTFGSPCSHLYLEPTQDHMGVSPACVSRN